MKDFTNSKISLLDRIELFISKFRNNSNKSNNQYVIHSAFEDENDKYLFLKNKLDDVYNYGVIDDVLYDRIENNIKEKIYGIDTQKPLADVIVLEEIKNYKDIA